MELLPEFFLDERGIIAIIFTIVAAVVSATLENKKQKQEQKQEDSELIDKAFTEMTKTVDIFRQQNEEMKRDFKFVREELDDCRHKYHNQIEINNAQSAQLTKLNLEMIYLVDKKSLDK
jgi:uncharacterized protein YlxW (UPF0749 family)|tara:strand:- start:5629 stop:5985 length:357 start_codon:yes stop_codon:yes gene_type:complete